MVCKNLLRLLFSGGLTLSPLAVHAQTPPQFINASTCSYNNNEAGLFVVGPYLYGPGGTAYCNLTPPVHNYGQAAPTLSSVVISGYAEQGGSVRARVCKNASFAGPSTIECGPERVSVGTFYDSVELPAASALTPTGYFIWVTLTPPFAALSGLSVVWIR